MDRVIQSDPVYEIAPLEQLRREASAVGAITGLTDALNAVPSLIVIVNAHRQVIFANARFIQAQRRTMDQLLGKRPGDLLSCENAIAGTCNCGTSEGCATCGASLAILTAQNGAPDTQDCRIRQRDTAACLDLRVTSTPLTLEGQQFTILALEDTGHENRRRTLERIFFHDLLNTLGALTGYAQLLDGAPPQELTELTTSILRLSDTLAEEIRAQRDLAAAENHELDVRLELLNTRELVQAIAIQFRNHPASRGRALVVSAAILSSTIRTDPRLLRRILSNMVKNALEASAAGDTVTLGCRAEDERISFFVHNPQYMQRDVQLQVFHRSFSTKGTGRGLGTYSMKLLGEGHLRGRIDFTSTSAGGTTFTASFPPDIAARPS